MWRFYQAVFIIGALIIPLWYGVRTKREENTYRTFWRELLLGERKQKPTPDENVQLERERAEKERARAQREIELAKEREAARKRALDFWGELLERTENAIRLFPLAASESDRWFREVEPLARSETVRALILRSSAFVTAFDRVYKPPQSRAQLEARLGELRTIQAEAADVVRTQSEKPSPFESFERVRRIAGEFSQVPVCVRSSRASVMALLAVMRNERPDDVEEAKKFLQMRAMLREIELHEQGGWRTYEFGTGSFPMQIGPQLAGPNVK